MINEELRMTEGNDIRLNKYLAECGVCSRREADVLISEGKVTEEELEALLKEFLA